MTLNVAQILLFKYPTDMASGNIVLQDDGDGAYIKHWDVEGVDQPSLADIQDWADSAEVTFAQNKLANQAIYDQLDVIDAKTIRPLREGDTARLATLNTQAAALRAKLLPTS